MIAAGMTMNLRDYAADRLRSGDDREQGSHGPTFSHSPERATITSIMESVIASVRFVAVEQDGSRLPIDVEIGAPYKEDPKKYDTSWRCPVSMKNPFPSLPDMAGADSFQALTLALHFVRRQLEAMQQEGIRLVTVLGGKDFEFPIESYFPPPR
jgi:hypothetical protein